ncbi:MAG: VWA domain-containing protein [Candidatus Dependentiae bacterium]|nr:VWA domain-containing protein [Candidatus Dependentiae bacterium]
MKIWFTYPAVLVGGAVALIFIYLIVRYRRREPTLEWPYAAIVSRLMASARRRWSIKRLVRVMRVFSLLSLLIATARPVYIDENSRLPVEGRDIMLVLDVSGSMQIFDDERDRTTRFAAAKREVLHFIDRRVDDQLGLVFFAATAFSRCPLTHDKKLLKSLVSDLQIGMINPDGTVLSAALAVAVNRLRTSKAQSKSIIVLTDGAPSDYDIPPDNVISLARQSGIKIYTIGVGSERGGFAEVPLYGMVQCKTPLNVALLERFAYETGGAFFRAERPDDVARVYQMIDALEKSAYEVPRYTRQVELFAPFAWLAFASVAAEIVMRAWWVVL